MNNDENIDDICEDLPEDPPMGVFNDEKKQKIKKNRDLKLEIKDVDDFHATVIALSLDLEQIADSMNAIDASTNLPEKLKALNELDIDPEFLKKQLTDSLSKLDFKAILKEAIKDELKPLSENTKNLLFEVEKNNTLKPKEKKTIFSLKGKIGSFILLILAAAFLVYIEFFASGSVMKKEPFFKIFIPAKTVLIDSKNERHTTNLKATRTAFKYEKGFFYIKTKHKTFRVFKDDVRVISSVSKPKPIKGE